MPHTPTGKRVHRAQVAQVTGSAPNPDGGWTDVYTPLDPPDWDCEVAEATPKNLESIGAGTVLAQATHVLRGDYHPGLTTKCRVTVTADRVHLMNVIAVLDPGLRGVQTNLVCAEVVE
jgi:hypothetical protein